MDISCAGDSGQVVGDTDQIPSFLDRHVHTNHMEDTLVLDYLEPQVLELGERNRAHSQILLYWEKTFGGSRLSLFVLANNNLMGPHMVVKGVFGFSGSGSYGFF